MFDFIIFFRLVQTLLSCCCPVILLLHLPGQAKLTQKAVPCLLRFEPLTSLWHATKRGNQHAPPQKKKKNSAHNLFWTFSDKIIWLIRMCWPMAQEQLLDLPSGSKAPLFKTHLQMFTILTLGLRNTAHGLRLRLLQEASLLSASRYQWIWRSSFSIQELLTFVMPLRRLPPSCLDVVGSNPARCGVR